jgi:hypothetical protein
MSNVDDFDPGLVDVIRRAFADEGIPRTDAMRLLWAVVQFRARMTRVFDALAFECCDELVTKGDPSGCAVLIGKVARHLVLTRAGLWDALQETNVVAWFSQADVDCEVLEIVLSTLVALGRRLGFGSVRPLFTGGTSDCVREAALSEAIPTSALALLMLAEAAEFDLLRCGFGARRGRLMTGVRHVR